VDQDSGEIENTFSIITTRANPLLEEIHNSKKRMPVILPEDKEMEWLDQNKPLVEVLSLLEPYPESALGAHTISKMITSRGIDKNVPELIEPFQYPENN
jgi:putative SOS response-associated peptidase YedK